MYNKGMRGTDIGDQSCSYYAYTHKSRRWPRRFFTHFLQVSISNARLLYNKHCNKKMSIKEFTEEIIKAYLPYSEPAEEQLPANVMPAPENVPLSPFATITPENFHHRRTWIGMVRERLEGAHWPTLGPMDAEEEEPTHRGKCMVCNRNSRAKCVSCNVYLCLHENVGSNCYWKFHSCVDFTQ